MASLVFGKGICGGSVWVAIVSASIDPIPDCCVMRQNGTRVK
jgi:hypothetical protein